MIAVFERHKRSLNCRTQDCNTQHKGYRLNRCSDSDVRDKFSRRSDEWRRYLLEGRLHEMHTALPLRVEML
jgi:hypothetical protein